MNKLDIAKNITANNSAIMDIPECSDTGNKNSNSKTSTKEKTSKQLSYYYRNKTKINKQKRINYKITHKGNKAKRRLYKYIKSSNQKTSLYYSDTRKEIEQYNDSKPILSLDSLISLSCDKLIPEYEETLHNRTVTTGFFALPAIVFDVLVKDGLLYSDIEAMFPELSSRQLQRDLQLLVKLKWLVRWGNYDWTRYYVNPFLLALFRSKETYAYLCWFTKFRIDFFDLMNIPLLNALSEKITLVETKFSSYFHKDQWIKAFFEGQMTIRLHTHNGIYKTILPVNLHAANKREGKTNNPYGFPHHTLPLSWKLFDILTSSQYHNGNTYIHFDNSFKIIKYEASKNAGSYHNYLTFKKPFEHLFLTEINGKKNKHNVWSTKNCQYVEVSDFDLLQRLFTERFVNGKRRKDLFDALEIEYRSKKHKKNPFIRHTKTTQQNS